MFKSMSVNLVSNVTKIILEGVYDLNSNCANQMKLINFLDKLNIA